MKNQKGITLIALVITIIVLLILAGVSIATLTGDNGLLTRSKDANATNIEATVDEQVRMAIAALRLQIANSAATNASYDARQHAVALAADVLKDLKQTSGKSASGDWAVVATPDTDAEATTDASLLITYAAKDYQNAKNDSAAKIKYAVRINQQTLKISEKMLNYKTTQTDPTAPDPES